MKPGHTQHPARSTVVAPAASTRLATCAMRPSSTRTSYAPSIPAAGSTTLAFLSSSFTVPSGQQVEHGHAHRDAAADLIENHRRLAVGDVAHDLDAAVDGAGVHDDRVGGGTLQAPRVQAVERSVLPQRREEAAEHPLVLDA